MTAVRVRGIYATALTRRLLDSGYAIAAPSEPIRERFDDDLTKDADTGPAAATVSTTYDRQGVGVTGDSEAVADLAADLADVGVDALSWPDPAPAGAVANAEVVEARGGGATVDLPGGATGYLPFDAVDGYVDVGDRLRVQVRDPKPPWGDHDPRVGPDVRVERDLLALERDREGVRADAGEADATALVRTTELLDATAPDGWGLRWHAAAVDADHDEMGAALESAAETAREIDVAIADAPSPSDAAPAPVATPAATRWVWFGREARFALDEVRRSVTTTIPGHHRIKAADESASAGVDLAEALVGEASGEAGDGGILDAFPFGAVARQFGPTAGDRIAIDHGKPDGRLFTLGRGEVTDFDPAGAITVRRQITSEGTYDGLGTRREPGDTATTKLQEGRWWYPTVYRGEDGERKGTYVNVCTPVELFPDAARYVDLHVDVVKPPDGDVAVVDEDELAEAVDDGHVDEALAERALEVAAKVERALSD